MSEHLSSFSWRGPEVSTPVPDAELRWNWAAGIVPALAIAGGWQLVMLMAGPSEIAAQWERMYVLLALVVLCAAAGFLRFGRSTFLVVVLTLAGGALLAFSQADRLLDELEGERRQAESFADMFGASLLESRSGWSRTAEYLVVLVVVCAPLLAALPMIGLRRQPRTEGSWNWAVGAIVTATVLVAWTAGNYVATAVAGPRSAEMFGTARYSGVVVSAVFISGATLALVVALAMLRFRPRAAAIIGLVLAACALASVVPIWHGLHVWSEAEAETRSSYEAVAAEIRDRRAQGEAVDGGESFDGPYEPVQRSVGDYVESFANDLTPITIALLALGLRRRIVAADENRATEDDSGVAVLA